MSAFLVLGALSSIAAPLRAQQELPLEPLAIETVQGARLFQVEVARTGAQRAVGLMWRQSLAPDHGMLFDFERDRYATMWMKNTPVSLDMLFIARDGEIVSLAARTTPFSLDRISSGERARAVLELLAGSVERLGIAPGDRVRHSMFGNPPE